MPRERRTNEELKLLALADALEETALAGNHRAGRLYHDALVSARRIRIAERRDKREAKLHEQQMNASDPGKPELDRWRQELTL